MLGSFVVTTLSALVIMVALGSITWSVLACAWLLSWSVLGHALGCALGNALERTCTSCSKM